MTTQVCRVLSHATCVTITSDRRAHGSTATFEYANLIVSGKARLRAQVLDARLSSLVSNRYLMARSIVNPFLAWPLI